MCESMFEQVQGVAHWVEAEHATAKGQPFYGQELPMLQWCSCVLAGWTGPTCMQACWGGRDGVVSEQSGPWRQVHAIVCASCSSACEACMCFPDFPPFQILDFTLEHWLFLGATRLIGHTNHTAFSAVPVTTDRNWPCNETSSTVHGPMAALS